MCTVSWIHSRGGYQLLCNRDEKLARQAALAPRAVESGGVRYIAPVDGDRGGTWLSANARGVTVCLLNGWAGARRGTESRGLVVTRLAGANSALEAVERAAALDLRLYSPFTLVALEPDQPAMVLGWDGIRCRTRSDGDSLAPLVSSSVDPEGVRIRRLAEFRDRARRGPLNGSSLFEFHRSHGSRARGDAYSACMHRDDAETVSFSWVTVSPRAVEFFYTPAAPCRWAPGVTERLERRA